MDEEHDGGEADAGKNSRAATPPAERKDVALRGADGLDHVKRTSPPPRDRAVVVAVGSRNPGKVSAVREALSRWSVAADEVSGHSVPSGVSDQPIGLEETVEGAANRAAAALEAAGPSAAFAVGLESGVVEVDTGGSKLVLDFCACAVIKAGGGGRRFVGLSSAFALLPPVASTFRDRGYNESWEDVLGRSADPDGDGILGILSGGILSRPQQMAQAVDSALVQFRNADGVYEAS